MLRRMGDQRGYQLPACRPPVPLSVAWKQHFTRSSPRGGGRGGAAAGRLGATAQLPPPLTLHLFHLPSLCRTPYASPVAVVLRSSSSSSVRYQHTPSSLADI